MPTTTLRSLGALVVWTFPLLIALVAIHRYFLSAHHRQITTVRARKTAQRERKKSLKRLNNLLITRYMFLLLNTTRNKYRDVRRMDLSVSSRTKWFFIAKTKCLWLSSCGVCWLQNARRQKRRREAARVKTQDKTTPTGNRLFGEEPDERERKEWKRS